MSTIHGSCLCGDVAWELTTPPQVMTHCHCSRCRKAHGVAFATYVMCDADGFRLTRGADRIVRWESSPGFFRPFCRRCGAVVPDGSGWEGKVFVPAGPLDDDPGARPLAHIFVGSKAPWYEIADDLPRFDAYPPGVEAAVVPDPERPRAPGPGAHASCLCGGVAFVIDGEPLRFWCCHCTRCRKARAAAHGANLFVAPKALRFLGGEELIDRYKIPEARTFTQAFCRVCGSPMPVVYPERGIAVVPMGALDDDPGMHPQRHIFAASKAPWYEIPPGLPQDPEYPPAT